MILPRDRGNEWFWGLGAVTVDWWDLPPDFLCFSDEHGSQRTPGRLGACVIIFDALSVDQEGLGQTDSKTSTAPPPPDHRN